MSVSFDTLTAMPCRFTAGEVISWTESLPSYPQGTYTIAYKYTGQTPLDGLQQFTITGSGSGTTWTFTTPSAPKPGAYTYERQITKVAGSVMRVDQTCHGNLVIQPNYGTAPTETPAAQMVAGLLLAISTLQTNPERSTSFNGQSVSYSDLDQLQKQLIYWKSQVIAEQKKLAALTGCDPAAGGNIGVRFGGASLAPPFSPWYPWILPQ